MIFTAGWVDGSGSRGAGVGRRNGVFSFEEISRGGEVTKRLKVGDSQFQRS